MDHLQARCNYTLAGFFWWTTAPLTNIRLEALCHLDHHDPRRPPRSLPPAPSGILLCRWCARLPPYTSDLHLFLLAAFIYWGSSRLAHISKRTITLWFYAKLLCNKVTRFISVWRGWEELVIIYMSPSAELFISLLLPYNSCAYSHYSVCLCQSHAVHLHATLTPDLPQSSFIFKLASLSNLHCCHLVKRLNMKLTCAFCK